MLPIVYGYDDLNPFGKQHKARCIWRTVQLDKSDLRAYTHARQWTASLHGCGAPGRALHAGTRRPSCWYHLVPWVQMGFAGPGCTGCEVCCSWLYSAGR